MNLAIGFVALSLIGADLPRITPPRMANNPVADEIWQLTLPEAIEIGLDNSEGIRIISCGPKTAGITINCFGGEPVSVVRRPDPNHPVIVPVDASIPAGRFKTEVMALVRSIEQQYWALAREQTQLKALETTVAAAKVLLKREQHELLTELHCRGSVADVAEAEQRVEQFTLDMVAKTSDVITAERQLRHILGLPPADNRRIVPATAPTETYAKPDGCECVARFSQKVDASYQEFEKATRLRKLAAQRLEAQRAYYEEGRIPIDRYLDALSQYTTAVGRKAECLANYNVALAALEEAKGTLLEARKITLAGPPRRVNLSTKTVDPVLQKAGH